MDLLGSILSSMEKPPSTTNDKNKQMLKKRKQMLEKQQADQKAKLQNFREKIEKEINDFIQDPLKHKHKFAAMDKVYRNIVHDVSEIAGLCAFAFGEEEVDRYVMIFKKEHAPSDDELAALRRGEEYDPIKAKALALQKEKNRMEEIEDSTKRKQKIEPTSNYATKYEKLLGCDAGKAAAKIMTTNKQFGFVPSEQKKDKRSVEQTLADIQAKKKLKRNCEDKDVIKES